MNHWLVTLPKVLTRENEEDSVIEGLWAAGETACVSVHGANRLGANSLLELVVFGKAISDQIDCMTRPGERHEDLPSVSAQFIFVYEICRIWFVIRGTEYLMSSGIQNNVSSRIINSHIINSHFLVGAIYAFIIEEDTYKNCTICYGYLY